jgi:hypothetical protein
MVDPDPDFMNPHPIHWYVGICGSRRTGELIRYWYLQFSICLEQVCSSVSDPEPDGSGFSQVSGVIWIQFGIQPK